MAKKKNNKSPFPDAVEEEHPSFGMVSLSRFSTTPHMALFGSTVKHSHPVALRIHKAKRMRDLHKEWYFEGETVAEVFLSSVQLGEMLTNMNTTGVPCTINYSRDGKLEQAGPVPENSPAANTYNELKKQSEKASTDVKAMFVKLTELAEAGKPVGKKKLQELARDMSRAAAQIDGNMTFVLDSFRRDCERVVNDAKGEVEAFVSAKVEAAGAASLTAGIVAGLPLLEAGGQGDGDGKEEA